jgi:hypothetical protein
MCLTPVSVRYQDPLNAARPEQTVTGDFARVGKTAQVKDDTGISAIVTVQKARRFELLRHAPR